MADHEPTECGTYHDLVVDFGGTKPMIVTLCGSTRFQDDFIRVQRDLTLKGALVISVGMFGHQEEGFDWGTDEEPSAAKIALDELHLRKIDLADMVFIINKDGYIGTSTRREIDYATDSEKRIVYMETQDAEVPAASVGTPV